MVKDINLKVLKNIPLVTAKNLENKSLLPTRLVNHDRFDNRSKNQKPQWLKTALASTAAALFAVNALPAKASKVNPSAQQPHAKPGMLQRLTGKQPKLMAQTQWVHPDAIEACNEDIGSYGNYYNAAGRNSRAASSAFIVDWQNCLGVQDTPSFRRFVKGIVQRQIRSMERDAIDESRDIIQQERQRCLDSGVDQNICNTIRPTL